MNIFRALWEAFCETAKEEFTVTEQDRQRLAAQRQVARKRQNEEDTFSISNSFDDTRWDYEFHWGRNDK